MAGSVAVAKPERRRRREPSPQRIAVLPLAAALGALLAAGAATGEPPAAPEETRPASAATTPTSTATDEILITGTAFGRPRSLDPAAVTVLDLPTLRARGVTNLLDALRLVPGLAISQPGGAGSRTELSLRGLDPNHTLVMIDGIRRNDPTNSRGGAADLQTLPLSAVDRIEVVRGPLSSFYGADALAGAVNIVTKRGSDPGGAARVQVDRYAGLLASLEHRSDAVPAQVEHAGALTLVSTGEELPSEGEQLQLHLRETLGRSFGEATHAEALFRVSLAEASAFPDQSGGEQRAVLRTLEEREWIDGTTGLDVRHELDAETSLRARFQSFHRRESRESPGVAGAPGVGVPGEDSDDAYDRIEGGVYAGRSLPWGLSLAGGATVSWEQGTSDSLLFLPPALGGTTRQDFELDRVLGGPFVEGEWRCECGLTLLGGLKLEYNDETHAEWLPRGGLRYAVPRTPLTLRGTVGQGTKQPSFYALGNPVVGNAALAPEQSFGWDVGVDLDVHELRLLVQLTWFDLRVDDLVDFDPDTFSIVNRDTVDARGAELALDWTPEERLTVAGQVTFTSTDVRDSQRELELRPEWRGHVTVAARPLERLELAATTLVVGEVVSSSVPTGTATLDRWARLDLSARLRLRDDGVTLMAGIENVTDSDYEEAVGFPAPGVRPRVGVEVAW